MDVCAWAGHLAGHWLLRLLQYMSQHMDCPGHFGSCSLCMLIALLISQKFFYTEQKEQSSFRHGVRTLFANHHFALFLFMAFICGTAFATINNYLFAYMNQLQIDESKMGYVLTVATVAEVPVLFFADRLLIRFKPRGLLILSMAATGTSFIAAGVFQFVPGYPDLSTPQWINFSRALGGGSFLCKRKCPRWLERHGPGCVWHNDLWIWRSRRRFHRRHPFGKSRRPDDVCDLRRHGVGHAGDLCLCRVANSHST